MTLCVAITGSENTDLRSVTCLIPTLPPGRLLEVCVKQWEVIFSVLTVSKSTISYQVVHLEWLCMIISIVLYSVLLFIVDSVALSLSLSEHEQYYFSINWFSKSLRIFVCEQILVVQKRSHSFGALPQIFENLKVYSKNSKAIWTSCSFAVHVFFVCIESLFSHATLLFFFFKFSPCIPCIRVFVSVWIVILTIL